LTLSMNFEGTLDVLTPLGNYSPLIIMFPYVQTY